MKLLLFCLLIFTFTDRLEAEETKRVWKLVTLEWAPHSCESCPDQGIGLKILKDLFKSGNEEVEVTFLPWRRAKKEFSEGKFDLIYPLWIWEYDDFSLAQTPAFYHSPITMISNPKSTAPFCLVDSYSYGEDLRKMLPKGIAIEANAKTDEQCLKRLMNGRASGTLIDEVMLRDQIKISPELKEYELKNYNPGHLYLGHQQKDQEYLQKFLHKNLVPSQEKYQSVFQEFLMSRN